MSNRPEHHEAALRAVKGMNDVLPADGPLWERFEEAAAAVARAYGYRRIRTPIVEHAALFSRGIGQVTDIVEHEMYAFEDKADKDGHREYLALRPESTASILSWAKIVLPSTLNVVRVMARDRSGSVWPSCFGTGPVPFVSARSTGFAPVSLTRRIWSSLDDAVHAVTLRDEDAIS